METLQGEIFSWLGYLDRWSVSWQVAFILFVALTAPLTRRFAPLLKTNQNFSILLGPLTLLSTGLLLFFAQIPSLIVVQAGLFWALINAVQWIESRIKINDPKSELASWLGKIVRPAIFTWAVIYFIQRLSSLPNINLTSLGNFSGTEFSIETVFIITVGFYLIVAANKILATFVAHLIQFLLRFDNRTRKLLFPLFRYISISAGLIVLALWAGFDSSTFLVIFGSLSFGLGFGLKETLSNFVTGIWLILEGAIKPGEVLMIDNEACWVKHLGLRAITLKRQRDDAELIIPNQTLFETKTEVFTAGENDRRESIVVGAAYHHDPHHVIGLLEKIAQAHKRVLDKPMPEAYTTDFADSSITYVLKFSVRSPLEALNVASELRQQIWTAFEENDITIPFPQRQVYPMEWPPKDNKTLQ